MSTPTPTTTPTIFVRTEEGSYVPVQTIPLQNMNVVLSDINSEEEETIENDSSSTDFSTDISESKEEDEEETETMDLQTYSEGNNSSRRRLVIPTRAERQARRHLRQRMDMCLNQLLTNIEPIEPVTLGVNSGSLVGLNLGIDGEIEEMFESTDDEGEDEDEDEDMENNEVPPLIDVTPSASEEEEEANGEDTETVFSFPGFLPAVDIPPLSSPSEEEKTTDPEVNTEPLFNCSICYSELTLNNAVTTNCNHKYCNTCFFRWLETNATCAICRAPLNSKTNLTDAQLDREYDNCYQRYQHLLYGYNHLLVKKINLSAVTHNLEMKNQELFGRNIRLREMIDYKRGYNDGCVAAVNKVIHQGKGRKDPMWAGKQLYSAETEWGRGFNWAYNREKEIIKKTLKKLKKRQQYKNQSTSKIEVK